jgi:hypothetical protein
MKSNKSWLLLAVLLCPAALFLCWWQFSSRPVNYRPSAAAGEVIFGEVARLVNGNGNIVLISRPLKNGEPDANGERVSSFSGALRGRPTFKLTTEWAPPPPPGVMDLGNITPEQFLAAMGKNPEANVMVVFAGLPPWSEDLMGKISARSLKVIAVCGYGPNVRRWFESKALSLAVVPRFEDPPAGTPPPKTPKDWFDHEYQIVTPADLAQMPY